MQPALASRGAAQAILGPNNLAFKSGPGHKAIRKSFLSLFTRKALGTYLEMQDAIIRRHLALWTQHGSEFEIRPFVRCGGPPLIECWCWCQVSVLASGGFQVC